MQVIALSGWKGSGKDTAADFLSKGYYYNKISFASKLKDLVASTYGVPREDLDSPSKKEQPLIAYPAIPTDPFSEKVHLMLSNELQSGFWTPRALCILEGSIKRSVYSNFWVKTVIQEVLDNPNQKYIISDMRYRSEADTLKIFLGDKLTTVRINRFKEIGTTDPSERDLDDYKFDVQLYNTGTPEEFYRQLNLLVHGVHSA